METETTIEKPYRAFGDFLRDRFGCKVYKVTLDAGFTCPNRDGTLGTGGCIYCNNEGFSPNSRKPPSPIRDQMAAGMEHLSRRFKAEKFIAYFQAYTNTYAPVGRLRELYDESLVDPRVIGLSVGTRPDCLPDEVVSLLGEYSRDMHTWVEVGLQSASDATLERMRRRHGVGEFVEAVERLKAAGDIFVCAHVILGLPGETRDEMLRSARLLSDLGVDGVKVHLLHVLRNTELEEMHKAGRLRVFEMTEYVQLVCDYLERLRPDMVIQRLTADGPPDILVAPMWAMKKKQTVEMIEKEMARRGARQGARWRPRVEENGCAAGAESE